MIVGMQEKYADYIRFLKIPDHVCMTETCNNFSRYCLLKPFKVLNQGDQELSKCLQICVKSSHCTDFHSMSFPVDLGNGVLARQGDFPSAVNLTFYLDSLPGLHIHAVTLWSILRVSPFNLTWLSSRHFISHRTLVSYC